MKPHDNEFFKGDSTNVPVMGAAAEGMSFMGTHLTREALSAGASLVVMDKGRSSEAIFDQALSQADTLVDRVHLEHLASEGNKWRPGKATLAKPAPWYRAFDKS